MSTPNDPAAALDALAAKPSLELRRRDADGDGVLTPEEFAREGPDAEPSLNAEKLATFDRYDANHDGVLTDAELKAGRKADRDEA